MHPNLTQTACPWVHILSVEDSAFLIPLLTQSSKHSQANPATSLRCLHKDVNFALQFSRHTTGPHVVHMCTGMPTDLTSQTAPQLACQGMNDSIMS